MKGGQICQVGRIIASTGSLKNNKKKKKSSKTNARVLTKHSSVSTSPRKWEIAAWCSSDGPVTQPPGTFIVTISEDVSHQIWPLAVNLLPRQHCHSEKLGHYWRWWTSSCSKVRSPAIHWKMSTPPSTFWQAWWPFWRLTDQCRVCRHTLWLLHGSLYGRHTHLILNISVLRSRSAVSFDLKRRSCSINAESSHHTALRLGEAKPELNVSPNISSTKKKTKKKHESKSKPDIRRMQTWAAFDWICFHSAWNSHRSAAVVSVSICRCKVQPLHQNAFLICPDCFLWSDSWKHQLRRDAKVWQAHFFWYAIFLLQVFSNIRMGVGGGAARANICIRQWETLALSFSSVTGLLNTH